MERLKRFDTVTSKWILSWPSRWQSLLAGITFLGEPWIVLAIAAGGLVSAAASNQQALEWAFIWAGTAYGINTLIKQITRRRRPHNRRISMLGIRSYSFPSGHAFGSLVFYGLYANLVYRHLSFPADFAVLSALAVIVILIGVSRVSLGTHYPTDVVGGWLLGSVSLYLIVWLVL
ncbi:MAG TPA: phosphatase PAP2 family protein [Candidatus Saccharimonadales bacterium]|jgi:undecaprenyl-diphosphatase|nr:phosphatase PAP2 family protein [Candidatus Saccharimonadales bacterium]